MSSPPASSTPRSSRGGAAILAGVFLTGCPIGLLMQMVMQHPWNWVAALASSLITGLISVAWAAAFIHRRLWWLAVVIPAQAFGPMFIFRWLHSAGLIRSTPEGGEEAFRIALGISAVACMVTGYVLMIRYIRSRERLAERARAELDVAQQIHAGIVPPIDATCGDITVIATSLPSGDMGGDLVDAVARGSEIDVIVADVSGHGVGAGIVMGMLKSSARTLLRSRPSLESLLSDLNQVLSELLRPGMFVTLACARVRPGGETEYALAGHLPIFHLIASSGELREFNNDRLPLGVELDETFRSGTMRLAPGDSLVFLTDGLMEVQDADGRQLGLDSLRRTMIAGAGKAPGSLSRTIFDAARSHGPRLDDQSVLVVHRRPS